MSNRYAILIRYRKDGKDKFLLVREQGESLLHFPMIKEVARKPHKNTIKKTLKERYGLEDVDPIRISNTGYQGPGIPYFRIPLYEVEVKDLPSSLTSNKSIAWMDSNEIHSHLSQMSFLMQYAIVPLLDEEDAWPA